MEDFFLLLGWEESTEEKEYSEKSAEKEAKSPSGLQLTGEGVRFLSVQNNKGVIVGTEFPIQTSGNDSQFNVLL